MVRISTSRSGRAGQGARRRMLRRLVAVSLISLFIGAIIFLALLLASSGFRTEMERRSGARSTTGVLQAIALAPVRLASARLGAARPPSIAIDIKFKHLHKIHEKRAEALRTGVLETGEDDWVPADLELGAGQVATARMKLAEGPVGLLEGGKWPLIVRLRSEGHVFGMRRFVLRPPDQHGFQAQSLYFERLRTQDVIAPRTLFAEVSLNGKRLGVMVVEEVFSREMLEFRERRDGPILRLLPAGSLADDPRLRAGSLAFDPVIAAMRPMEIRRSDRLSRNLELAERMLRAYLVGKVAAGDVFDRVLMGRFLAVTALSGAQNALLWPNLRFYFNPLTARLEPVGHAGEPGGSPDGEPVPIASSPVAVGLLEDERIRSEFAKAIERIASETLAGEWDVEERRIEAELLRTLHREFPLRGESDRGPLLRRARRGSDEVIRMLPPPVPPPRFRDDRKVRRLFPLPERSIEEILARAPFLSWDAAARALRIPAGVWRVEGSLILPRGVALEIAPGTRLRFGARDGIIARGPLRFPGTAEAPIVLEGPAGASASALWSGIYVIESSEPSRWSHVAIHNTGGFKRGRWQLAGGVVFRKSRIEMEHCSFRGNLSDDAINVVRGSFDFRDIRVSEAVSDAFDGDYVEGRIEGGWISEAGGDAVDLGGSNVAIDGLRLSDIRDKALAVGEGSKLSATGLRIEDVGIGVASKNGGVTSIVDSSLSDVSIAAFTAYMNRAQYGPGTLIADRNRIARVAVIAIAQTGSRIVIDGQSMPQVDAAIEALYKDDDFDRSLELP